MSRKQSISHYFSHISKKPKGDDDVSNLPNHNQEGENNVIVEDRVSSTEIAPEAGNNAQDLEDYVMDSTAMCALSSESDSEEQDKETQEQTSDINMISDIANSPYDAPRQPILHPFPQTTFGNVKRSFQQEWYNSFPWLEYSVEKNSAFCFPCRFFVSDSKLVSTFTKMGYNNWKKALDKDSGFRKHDNSQTHKAAQISWTSFKQMKKQGGEVSVSTAISEAYAAEIRENRLYLSRIIQALLYSAVQGIAQRGHDESTTSTNKGNFLELMELMGNLDPLIKKRIENGRQNAKYLHHSVQDEIFDIIAKHIIAIFKEEVAQANYFALIVDESKDISKSEQISVVIRYYLNGLVYERFLGFRKADNLDAKSLLSYIKQVLTSSGVNIQNCVAQSYDGASVMSGNCGGVQALFKQEVPQAVYVHCMNHRLNLVVVDVCKSVKESRDFFIALEYLYVFLSGSVTHAIFLSVQKEMNLPNIALQRLSDTRWSCQSTACLAVKRTFSAILVTLWRISERTNNERAAEARSIINKLDMLFLVQLCFFSQFLQYLNVVSKYLQNRECDIAQACRMMNDTCELIIELRNSPLHVKTIWEEATKIAQHNGVNTEINYSGRHRRLPPHLAKYILIDHVSGEASQETLSSEEQFRTHLVLPILDRTLAELKRRFTENSAVLEGISSFHPQHEHFLNFEILKGFAEHYGLEVDEVENELRLVQKTIKRYEQDRRCSVKDVISFTKFLQEFKLAFHELYKLSVIAVTIPASSAACERTFSCMKRVKSYLRNSMNDDRLSNLAVIAVESSTAKHLNIEEIVDNFDANHKNRRINLH